MGKGIMSIYRRAVLAAVFLTLLTPSFASATEALAKPEGRAILTVRGNVAITNDGGTLVLDRAMLTALPQHEVRTTTEWTDGVKVFRGPLVSDVLAAAGADGSVVAATALNDYSVEIPMADFRTYPVILALWMDGAALTVRDKGPIWIVYPRDDFDELRSSEMNSRWIWQLRSLEIR